MLVENSRDAGHRPRALPNRDRDDWRLEGTIEIELQGRYVTQGYSARNPPAKLAKSMKRVNIGKIRDSICIDLFSHAHIGYPRSDPCTYSSCHQQCGNEGSQFIEKCGRLQAWNQRFCAEL
jgi:hypothetical protein